MAQLVTLRGDSSVLTAAMAEFWGSVIVERELGATLRNSRDKMWVVAFFDGSTIGFSGIVSGSHFCSAYVLPAFRQRGVYGEMIQERLAVTSGTVTTIASEASRTALVRSGFAQTGKRGRFFKMELVR